MLRPDPTIKNEMSQAAVDSFPGSLPSNTKDSNPKDYSLQQYLASAGVSALNPAHVSSTPGMESLWTSGQGLMTGYNNSLESQLGNLNGGSWMTDPTGDSMMGGCEQLYRGLFSADSNNDLGFSLNMPGNVPTSGLTSATTIGDQDATMTGYPFPSQPSSSHWASNPMSTPMTNHKIQPGNCHRPQYLAQLQSDAATAAAVTQVSTRRRSEPDLIKIQDPVEVERKIKYANRRASHNVVEKRYRINLNRKFYELEQVVIRATDPITQTQQSSKSPTSVLPASKSVNGNGNMSGNAKGAVSLTGRPRAGFDCLPGEPPEPKHHSPKAAIISSALKYIASLQKENSTLRERLCEFEARNAMDPSPSAVRRPRGCTRYKKVGGENMFDQASAQDQDDAELLGDIPEGIAVKSEE
ncbi:hypothetical protein BDV19DRAFT_393140 [Aspergillus venezuelensis]